MTKKQNKKPSTRTYAGLSESERLEERRQRFLQAGLEVFGTLGLRKATVRVLCAEAGLTSRYFYEAFADVESLFCAVYQYQTHCLGETILSQFPQVPDALEDRIRALLKIFFTAMRDERIVRVLYIEALTGSETVRDMYHSNMEALAELGIEMIKNDHPKLKLSRDKALAIIFAINGACFTSAVQWMLGGYRIKQATVVESCTLLTLGTMEQLGVN